jgi:hypothetical protein
MNKAVYRALTVCIVVSQCVSWSHSVNALLSYFIVSHSTFAPHSHTPPPTAIASRRRSRASRPLWAIYDVPGREDRPGHAQCATHASVDTELEVAGLLIEVAGQPAPCGQTRAQGTQWHGEPSAGRRSAEGVTLRVADTGVPDEQVTGGQSAKFMFRVQALTTKCRCFRLSCPFLACNK